MKSIAFLSAPLVEWLYSGVTNTKPSNEAILSAHARVCSFAYCPRDAGIASSRCGSAKSARSTISKSASSRTAACSYTHLATWSPTRPGRVLPMMMPMRTWVMRGELLE